ncbi:MAG TPA: heavy metal-binding domain-containing protein [Streptosporangiaceae bacterium]|nr:heavy metal-binding domain-containing protein [Streptosporangiaceae bacterium]
MQPAADNLTASRTMIVTTTENIPGTRVVKTIGQVFGLTVRSRSLGGNIAAGLKSLVGGEIGSYVKLNEDARRQAIDRMVRNAAAMGANAVTMMRFDSTEMGRSMSEIVAYGTARIVEAVADSAGPAGPQG